VPPFAFKDGSGNWQGISIDLWRDIAGRLQLAYRFEETANVKDLIDGVADKKFDAGVAAITVTEERQRRLDFSHPFFTTGLAIATQPSNESPVWSALSAMFTWTWGAVALGVFAAIVAIGYLLWFVERKANTDMDRPSEGFWSSLTMLLTASFTSPEPRTLVGRTLATLWVVISLVLLTFFTGVVTSALTVQSLQGRVRGVEDLPRMKVGGVGGSTGMQWLSGARIPATSYANIPDGLTAVAEGRIDAFVHDAPILQHMAQKEFKDRIIILPDNFAPQDYAFALPTGSPLRRAINQELLAIKSSDIWKKRLFEYLGER
jgi:ABC-type amino acid transport substrate-binding protein